MKVYGLEDSAKTVSPEIVGDVAARLTNIIQISFQFRR